MCIAGSKLPATGDFYRGPETAPYKVVCTQPQWSEFSWQEWKHTSWWALIFLNNYFTSVMLFVWKNSVVSMFASRDHDLPSLTREQFCGKLNLQVQLWTRRSATLQSLTSSCAATLASRAQAVLLTTMSCGMRTTSQLMHCRPLPTTSATRKPGNSCLSGCQLCPGCLKRY